MATNLQIDDKLVFKALRLGRHKTRKEAASTALVEYIHQLEQERVLFMFGRVDYDPDYDYRKQRRRT